MTRTQEVVMIEAAVKSGRVQKLPYLGDTISLVPYLSKAGTGQNGVAK